MLLCLLSSLTTNACLSKAKSANITVCTVLFVPTYLHMLNLEEKQLCLLVGDLAMLMRFYCANSDRLKHCDALEGMFPSKPCFLDDTHLLVLTRRELHKASAFGAS